MTAIGVFVAIRYLNLLLILGYKNYSQFTLKSNFCYLSGVQISFRRFLSKIGHLLWKSGTLCFIRSILHRLPLLFPIFLTAYGYQVGKILHLLRLSTKRPNFWYFHMMWSAAQTGRASSIEIRGNQKEQCLVNTAGGVKLSTWVFPNRFWPAPEHVDQENNFFVSGVVVDTFFLECSTQFHQLCLVDSPRNCFVWFEQLIRHDTKLIPPNTQEFFPWIFGLAIDVEAWPGGPHDFFLFGLS